MNERFESPKGTECLCGNVVRTRFEDLSEENIRVFKDRLLDMAGCILGGAIVKENAFLQDRMLQWGGLEEAPVFASGGKRLPLPHAALLNALKARSNDFGSMLFRVHGDAMPSHMGETLIPLSLTLADAMKTDGQAFITNVVASEDMMGRLLYVLPVRFPTDMQLISSAAAAVCSRYYGFDAAQMKAALGFAATNATDPGDSYFDYSEEFKYHNGASAQMGIMAAEMVKGGWKGLEDPYFGRMGLISTKVKDGQYPELYEKMFEDLGEVYYTETAFKLSPGGIPMTAIVRIGKKLHEMVLSAYGRVAPEDIREVRVYGAKNIYHGYYSNPFVHRDQINALFAYRFAVVCALLNHGISVRHVQTDYIRAHEELVRLSEEATMEIYQPADGFPRMKAEVIMKDGHSFEAEESFFVMDQYPDREELIAKFRDQFDAYGKLPEENADKMIELASSIDKLADMREFTELMY